MIYCQYNIEVVKFKQTYIEIILYDPYDIDNDDFITGLWLMRFSLSDL